MTVYLVRHALALPKARWVDDDVLRPLSQRGRAQAANLGRWLGRQSAISSVVVSPTARCIETVLAFARDHELDIVARRELAIGRVSAAAELVRQLQTTRGHAVVCTHGEVIPPLLTSLGYVAEGASVACAKGSVWTIDDRAGGASYVEQPTATQDDDSLRRVAR